MPNGDAGIFIDSAAYTMIGGPLVSDRNIVSGNGREGIRIKDGGHHNTIVGNYIGTDASGAIAIGNGQSGIELEASSNTVGGESPGQRNVVSGNGDNGVRISDVSDNIVIGNYIGTNAAGNMTLPNRIDGVEIVNGASNNAIGGDKPAHCNFISAIVVAASA